jgi:hypothetical protein
MIASLGLALRGFVLHFGHAEDRNVVVVVLRAAQLGTSRLADCGRKHVISEQSSGRYSRYRE